MPGLTLVKIPLDLAFYNQDNTGITEILVGNNPGLISQISRKWAVL
jgi:hypothetical protein